MAVRKRSARKQGQPPPVAGLQLEQIKRLVVIAMFSDDALMDYLVLKGGNALDLVYEVGARASMDIDLSMEGDFPGGSAALIARIERALAVTFRDANVAVFDVRIADLPENLSPEVAHFWGGYRVEFKLIDAARHRDLAGDIETMRRAALKIGSAGKFLIDISRYEYTAGKQQVAFDGYQVFVYSRAMIIAEKLRAICQQLPEYGPIVRRERPGAPRARDFVDIWMLCRDAAEGFVSPENKELLAAIFAAKRVPLAFLRQIHTQREFHRVDYPAVIATMRPGVKLAETFDADFDFVLQLVAELEPLGDM